MRSFAFQTPQLRRASSSGLHCLQAVPRAATRALGRQIPRASLTTASKPAPRTVAKPAAKPASTFTKPAAKVGAERSTVSPPSQPLNGSAAPTPASATATTPSPAASETENGNEGESSTGNGVNWTTSFQGVGIAPFSAEAAQVLMADLRTDDIEIKPDGIVYLPEIKYRRILNRAFGPGGWGMVPRGDLAVEEKVVTREYALIVQGRFVAQARGECQYFSDDTITTAGEGCKSNALMRCCKDIGIASELWDPRYIRNFKKTHCDEVWVERVSTEKRRQIWLRKDSPAPAYPYQLVKK